MLEKENNEILNKLEKQKSRKRIIIIIIALALLAILIFIALSFYLYFKSPEKQLSLGANIEEVRLSPEKDIVYIKLAGGINYGNITKIKFIFTDKNKEEYYYETIEGIKEIEVPFKRSFWDWLFGKPAFSGEYDYEIKADEINLDNFGNINEVSVLFEYKTETGEETETPVLDTTKPTPAPTTTTGGGGGPSGPSPEPTPPTCTDSDTGINYYEKGTTSDGATNEDYCNDSMLFEYYCNNSLIEEVNYDCSLKGKVCLDGRCVELIECTDNENCSYLNDVCGVGICNLTINQCQQIFNSSTNVCRASIGGECDVAEKCSGGSAVCPVDVFKSAGISCLSGTGTCDGNGNCVVVSGNVYLTNEDTPINITLNSSIIGNFIRTVNPAHGTAQNKSSLTMVNFINLTYKPNANYNGNDYFKYNVTDGINSEIIRVNITINPVDDAPVLIYQSVAVFGIDASAGSEIHTYTIKAGDVENDPITFSYTSSVPPTNANLNPSTGEFSFTADAGDLNDNYAITFTATEISAKEPLGPTSSISRTVNIRMRETKEYYIRKGITGDGSDWNNAFDNLSAAESLYGGLVRGATYYIADGVYGDYRFNDPTDGEKYITIKKAIDNVRCGEIGKTPMECHGSAGDWDDSYGDEIALFTTSDAPESGIIWFETSYYVFDGQVGGGPENWKTGHGFKINSSAPFRVGSYPSVYLISLNNWIGTGSPNFLKISHVELQHRGVNTPDVDCGIFFSCSPSDAINYTTRETFAGRPGPFNVTIDHCYMHDFGWIALQTKQSSNWLFEYNYVARTTSSAGNCIDDLDGDDMGYCRRQFVDEPEPRECNLTLGLRENLACPKLHGCGWQDFGSDNMTIRYNIWEDIEGTGVLDIKHDTISIVLPPGGEETYWVNENWDIYGNVFFYAPGNPYDRFGTAHGVLGATASNDAPSNNFSFYNNIIINWPGWGSGVYLEYGTGNKVYNNIWYNCSNYEDISNSKNVRFYGEGIEYNYNIYSDSPLYTEVYAAEHDIETTGDPFVDWVNLDFSLKAATEAGISLGVPYNYDMFGIERGVDGNWDRGAIEYTLSCSFDSDCDVLDSLPCTDYYCDIGGTNICIKADTDGNSCDDGDECTYNDNCFGGGCFGTQINCPYYLDLAECEDSVCASCQWNITTGCEETVLPKGYIAYWKFDTQAAGITPDETGVHDGTLINEALIEIDSEGNNVLGLDGDRDYVYLGTHQSLNLTNQTLTAWFKLDEVAGKNNYLFSDGFLYFSISSGDIYLLYRNSSGGVKHCDDYYADVESEKWYHVAATYEILGDDVEINLYLNGTLRKRCEISEGFIPYPIISVGARHQQAGGLNGSLDDAMIYDRELSVDEILKIYNAQKDVEVVPFSTEGTAGSFSPFTQLLNFLKSLLTRETGKAILTGKTITGNVIKGNAVNETNESRESKVPYIILSLLAGIILIIVIIIVKIKKNKKKFGKSIRRRIRKGK